MLALLDRFDPHVAGTPPLGIDLPTSDIDILCHAPDPAAFAELAWSCWADRPDFAMRQWIGAGRPVIVGFTAHGWMFEIFADALPVERQPAWRHFLVERRLLSIGGAGFRVAIMRHRERGAKTEPAFATVLGLPGDPYHALLAAERLDDRDLQRMIDRAERRKDFQARGARA